MSYDNSYSGTIGKNKAKEPGDKKPDYKGQININGVGHWLSGWIRKSQDGETFLSLSAEPKEKQAPSRSAAGGQRSNRNQDDDGSIPF
jgi:uncharacterized protein (DUF736 family)